MICTTTLLLIITLPLKGQRRIFAIQLGAFQNSTPDLSSFQSLKDLGQLFTDRRADGLTRLRLGDYPQRTVADSILRIVRKRGFHDAFTFQLEEKRTILPDSIFATSGKNVLYTIQVGTYIDRNSLPNTSELKQLGSLYELQEDGFIKLRLGAFLSKDSAEALLKTVRKYGYSRAFIAEIDPKVMLRDLTTNEKGELFQTTNVYKRMKGKLNNRYDIVAHVYVSGQSVSGYFNDPQTGQHRRFSYYGKLDSSFVFASGSRFIPQSLKLHFKDRESGEVLALHLQESYDEGGIRWEIISMYRKQVRNHQHGQVGADLYLEYPYSYELANKAEAQKLLHSLAQIKDYKDPYTAAALVEKQLSSNVRLVSASFPEYTWLSETYETKILENDRHFFTVRLLYERIGKQAESRISFRSWDLRNGEELTLANQLRPGADKALRNLLRRKLSQRYAHLRPSTADINASVEEMLANYYFTAMGISFFRQHQPWSAIEGSITLSVTYQEIAQWLRENSLARSNKL